MLSFSGLSRLLGFRIDGFMPPSPRISSELSTFFNTELGEFIRFNDYFIPAKQYLLSQLYIVNTEMHPAAEANLDPRPLFSRPEPTNFCPI